MLYLCDIIDKLNTVLTIASIAGAFINLFLGGSVVMGISRENSKYLLISIPVYLLILMTFIFLPSKEFICGV